MGNKDDCPYQRIEYLKNTDIEQWIDTGIIPSGNDNDFYITLMIEEAGNFNCPFGSYKGDGNTNYVVIYYETGYIGVFNGQCPNKNQGIRNIPCKFNKKYKWILLGNGINIINNVVYSSAERGFNDTPTDVVFNIFRSRIQEQNLGGIYRFYSFKWKKGTKMVLDLIPVRIGDEGFMYDRVSGKLFGNAGTGEFILGPDIN